MCLTIKTKRTSPEFWETVSSGISNRNLSLRHEFILSRQKSLDDRRESKEDIQVYKLCDNWGSSQGKDTNNKKTINQIAKSKWTPQKSERITLLIWKPLKAILIRIYSVLKLDNLLTLKSNSSPMDNQIQHTMWTTEMRSMYWGRNHLVNF